MSLPNKAMQLTALPATGDRRGVMSVERDRRKVNGTCRLCLRDSELRESHVIPKSYFTALKRAGAALLGSDDILFRNRRTQDSWSQHLFCQNCEQKFSRWEDYAIDALRRPNRHRVIIKKSPHSWELFNLDYERFRLFQLSVLFRAAISTRSAFQHFVLAPPALKRLRYLLNASEAPGENEFPCLMEAIWSPLGDGNLYTQVIGAPAPLNFENRAHYWFVFGGFCWYFVLPNLSAEQIAYHSYLQRGGYIKLPALEIHEHPVLSLAILKTELKSAAGWEL